MSKLTMSVDELSSLYVTAVTFSDNQEKHADNIQMHTKFLKDSDAFDGKQGDDAREAFDEISKCSLKLSENSKIISKFLDAKIGTLIELNKSDKFSEITTKALELKGKRLKK